MSHTRLFKIGFVAKRALRAAAGAALLAAVSPSFAQDAPVAKTCLVRLDPRTTGPVLVVIGRQAPCGKGSLVSFSFKSRLSGYLTEQLCDMAQPVTVLPGNERLDEPPRVSCRYTGELLEPERLYSGWPVVFEQTAPR